jgi:hypothetical protein
MRALSQAAAWTGVVVVLLGTGLLFGLLVPQYFRDDELRLQTFDRRSVSAQGLALLQPVDTQIPNYRGLVLGGYDSRRDGLLPRRVTARPVIDSSAAISVTSAPTPRADAAGLGTGPGQPLEVTLAYVDDKRSSGSCQIGVGSCVPNVLGHRRLCWLVVKDASPPAGRRAVVIVDAQLGTRLGALTTAAPGRAT